MAEIHVSVRGGHRAVGGYLRQAVVDGDGTIYLCDDRWRVVSGIELRGETLVVEREPNRLDALAIECSKLLDRHGVRHVFVAGYVSILAGRARATEDIDVLVERIDEATAEALVETLQDEGFWDLAMPLQSLYEMLSNGDNVWVAPNGEVTPHLEVKFVRDEFDRPSLESAITARIGGE